MDRVLAVGGDTLNRPSKTRRLPRSSSLHLIRFAIGSAMLGLALGACGIAHSTRGELMPLQPSALAVGPNGNLYLADPGRDQILERLSDGRFVVVAGTGKSGFSGDGGPATSAEIDDPGGLNFGPNATLYFADQGNGRVRAISARGTITTVAGGGDISASSGFVPDGTPALDASITPYDVAVSPNGQVYVATGLQVLRLSRRDTLQVVVGADIPYGGVHGVGGPAVDASADGVDGIAFDRLGDLWMFGFNTKAILEVTSKGVLREPAGDQDLYCRGDGGLATTPNGTVLAMSELSLVKLSSTAAAKTIFSFYSGTFHGIRAFSPNGIAVSKDGAIYVDTWNGDGFADKTAIASISPTGRFSRLLWEAP